MFRDVNPKVSFPQLEAGILAFWEEHKVFKRSVEERPEERLFIWYDGPPTANAEPGIHHVLARTFKDLFPRYKTMRGYRVPRRAGWDTHGLPVELEIEKELGLNSKREIEAFGISAFNDRCKESVARYVTDWVRLSERIAFWADMEHPYVTWHNEYVETGWWIFKQLFNAGLVYLDYRSTPHCPRCETSLSDHEVAQGYEEDVPDPSIYIRFRLDESGGRPLPPALAGASVLAWTTTPWTLPGNVALAVHPDADYGVYEYEGERLVLATTLAPAVLEEGVRPLATFRGEALANLTFEPLYRPEEHGTEVLHFGPDGRIGPLPKDKTTAGLRRLIAAEYVSLEDGTGVVHTAPAFGGEDFEEGKRHGLLFAQPLSLQGIMAAAMPGAGKFAKDADSDVMADLEARGLLFRSSTIRHTYPFCWRCKTPLLYYAKPSWYLRTTTLRKKLLASNGEINWYPGHIREGRYGNWLSNNVDWAVSRERYWGTPLPFWRCDTCGEVQCAGSRADLRERAADPAAVDALTDLHRPFIDAVKLRCPSCGSTATRVPEVADAWFDSGAMPYGQWHYPFENEDEFARSFPADFICEGIDQTRGWFYTLHAEAALLNNAAPETVPAPIAFRNVICHGHILDEKGLKMSSSRGNVVDPWSVIDRFGADAVRWYMCSAGFARNSGRFGASLVEEGLRRFQLTLWNTYSFFVSYANIDGVDPRTPPTGPIPEIDRWLLSEINVLVQRVTAELEQYDPTDSARLIDAFVDDLSNWYVRRNRRRFWRGVSESDDDKQSAYHTLYTALTTIARLLAPFMPFMAEELWQNLVRSLDGEAPESVHLAEWPGVEEALINEQLNNDTGLIKRICSLGRSARAKAQIKVRQPLQEVSVAVRGGAREREVIHRHEALILEELNVRELRIVERQADLMTYEARPNLPLLGPRLGSKVGSIRAALGSLDGDEIAELRRGGTLMVEGEEIAATEVLLEERPRDGYSAAGDGLNTVAITTAITPELADAGLARELVRRIQDLRREAGFDLADRIETWLAGGPEIARVVKAEADYIRQETLTVSLESGAPPAGVASATHEIGGIAVGIGVRRASEV